MTWGAPAFLPLLWLLLPVTWLVFHLGARRGRRLRTLISATHLRELAPEAAPTRARRLELLWLLAVALLLLALARPQWGVRWEEVRRRGLDIMVLMDTSRSMLAADLKPSRLQQAKWAVEELAGRLQGDRIGLVSFAGDSFLQCPLTIDYAAFLMTLQDVYVGIIPKGGTAIGQALETAVDSFDQGSGSDKVIILISDGEEHEGIGAEVLARLKAGKIRVFALGAGTLEGELVPAGEGDSGFAKDRQGRVVKSSLNEGTLEQIALDTGGAYVRAVPGDFGVERILAQGLAGLEREERESRLRRTHRDRYGWFIGTALGVLLIESTLRRGVRVRREGGP